MVPLNGALGRLLCKFFALLSVVFLLFWTFSQRSQSADVFDQLEKRLHFAQDQLDSLHAQVDVITKHKEKIEHLMELERQRFSRVSKDQIERISHLEAENVRLENALSNLNKMLSEEKFKRSKMDKTTLRLPNKQIQSNQHKQEPAIDSDEKAGQKGEDPFEDDHQIQKIRAPLMPKEEQTEGNEEKKVGKGKDKDEEEREDVGAEKDYVFERNRPRDDLVFKRANRTDNVQLISANELMKKLSERKRKEIEEEMGIVKADG